MYADVYIDFNGKKTISSKDGKEITIPNDGAPLLPMGHEICGKVKGFATDGVHNGKQVDWGMWCAMLTKKEIKGLFDGVNLSTINNFFTNTMRFVENLSDDGQYKVVVSEY